MLLVPSVLGPTSRASGLLALGLFLNSSNPLLTRKLFPVVVAAHVWGLQCCKKHVLFCSDNEAMVQMLNSITSKIPSLLQLLHNLLLSMAHYSFFFSAQHIPGVHNQITECSFLFPLAGILPVGPRCSANSNNSYSSASVGIDQFSLEQQCHDFFMDGLVPSICKTYATTQRKFFKFCLQPGQLHPFGSPCPPDE